MKNTVISLAIVATGIVAGAQTYQNADLEARVAALEERVYVLEELAIVPQDVPIAYYESPMSGRPSTLDAADVVPTDPAVSLDLVCVSNLTIVDDGHDVPGHIAIQEDVDTLRCVRYERFMPFPATN